MTERITAKQYREIAYAQVSEQTWQDRVVRVLKANGWVVYHIHDSRKQHWGTDIGFPDTVAIHEQRLEIAWLELKTMKGRTSKGQKMWLGILSKLALRINRAVGRQLMYVAVLRPNQYDWVVQYAGGEEPLR